MAKRRKPTTETRPIDSFATLLAEIAEAVELMRPHFPNDYEDALRHRATTLRAERYRTGRWPDFEQLAKAEAERQAASEAHTGDMS